MKAMSFVERLAMLKEAGLQNPGVTFVLAQDLSPSAPTSRLGVVVTLHGEIVHRETADRGDYRMQDFYPLAQLCQDSYDALAHRFTEMAHKAADEVREEKERVEKLPHKARRTC